jgi:hypothetical protein
VWEKWALWGQTKRPGSNPYPASMCTCPHLSESPLLVCRTGVLVTLSLAARLKSTSAAGLSGPEVTRSVPQKRILSTVHAHREAGPPSPSADNREGHRDHTDKRPLIASIDASFQYPKSPNGDVRKINRHN